MRRLKWAGIVASHDEFGNWQILPDEIVYGLDEFLRSLIDDASADAQVRYSPSCGDPGAWEFREVARLLRAQVLGSNTPDRVPTTEGVVY